MSNVLLVLGLLIITLNLTDFFFTTLSGNGSGSMTNFINRQLSKLFARRMGRKGNKWSGLVHLVIIFSNWILWMLVGAYLLFYSHEDFVINSTTQLPASALDRFYFTGFVVTTLGVGDFIPGTGLARVFTVFLSITGFVLLTTALTYLISVSNAVTKKKNLATFIAHMGNTPHKLYSYLTTTSDLQFLLNSEDELLQQIDTHANDHLSFPIVHHFLTNDRNRSAAIQLASFHEVLVMLLNKVDDKVVKTRLLRLKRAMNYFLSVTQITQAEVLKREDIEELRKNCLKDCNLEYRSESWEESHTSEFTDYLHSAGWSWKHVYFADPED